MRIHHLNCATMRPPLAPQMVAHVLLLERPDGLVLVDTGLGTTDVERRHRRLGRGFMAAVRPVLDNRETAVEQVRALGFDPGDVTDILVTHLDLDHAGGLGDFPGARVHVHATEYDAATHPSLREKARYVQDQWAHGPRWERHREVGEQWFGFAAVTALADDVLLIPLHGHTRGHSGIAVREDDGHWLLHAGDAFFSGGQVDDPPTCPASLAAFQRLMGVDDGARKDNLERLQELARGHGDEVTVFCAHDREQYEALRAR